MKLKATFTIELEEPDYVAAADRQRDMERLLSIMKERYPQASLRITERRRFRGERHSDAGPRVGITGRLNQYDG